MKFAPLNKAKMVFVPTGSDEVVIKAQPLTRVTGGPINALFARNVTVPWGTVPGLETVAVKVTGWPCVDPCGAEEVRAVVVRSGVPSAILAIAK